MSEDVKDDGGPAFPWNTVDGSSDTGMSLRDYFAAQALVECIRVAADLTPGTDPVLTLLFDKATAYAYFVADAMLAERSKP